MKLLNLLLLLTLLVACGQSPKPIRKSVKESFYLNSKSTECSKVNLYKNIASKENVVSLFKCLKYDKTFPVIYSSIKMASGQNFDLLNQILSKSFFKDTNSRNKLLGTIISKTNKASSQSLSHLAESFIKKKENVTSLSSILDLIRKDDRKVSKDFLISYLQFMGKLSRRMELSRKEIALNFSKENKTEFSSFLKIFFEEILLDQGSTKDNFIDYLEEGKWFVELMSSLGPRNFEKIVFFVSDNPSFLKGINTYKEAIDGSAYNCYDRSGSYVVDHSIEYRWQVENLYYKNEVDFKEELVSLVTRFNLYNQICHNDEFIPITNNLLKGFIEFLSYDGALDIMKQFAKVSLKSPSNTYLLLDFFSSNGFEHLEKMLARFKGNESFLKGIFSMLQSLSEENLADISKILRSLDTKFVLELKSVWSASPESVQDSLIDYVTEMFMTNKDIYPAFHFLNSISTVQEEEFSTLIQSLLERDMIEVIVNLLNELDHNPELHNEFTQFLSDDAIFDLLSILQRNRVNDLDGEQELEDNLEYKVNLDKQVKEKSCLDLLLELNAEKSLSKMISLYPSSCLENPSAQENFSLKIIRWAKNLNKSFQKLFNKDIVGEKGVLGQKMMHFLHQMVHVTTKYVRSSQDFSRETVEKVKNYFFKDQGVEKLEGALEGLLKIDNREQIISKLLSLAVQKGELSFEKDLKSLFKGLSLYTESQEGFSCAGVKKNSASCSVNLKELNGKLKNKGVKLDEKVVHEMLVELERSKFKLDDYLQLIKFLGEKVQVSFEGRELNKPRASKVESILRSVNFSNNYYAIYFFGKLSRSKSYMQTVEQLKRDFRLIIKLSPTLAKLRVLPADANKRFKIALENLDVLDDLGAMLPGKNYSYGDVLVEICKMLNKLSPKRSRAIRKISIPNKNKVRGHLGHLLSVLAEGENLSVVTSYLHSNLSEQKSSSLSFKSLKSLLEILDQSKIKVTLNDEINFKNLPSNKRLFNHLFALNKERQKNYLDYLKVISNVSLHLNEPREINLSAYHELFSILADEDVDYAALLSTLDSVHQEDPEYINSLLEYSLLSDGVHSKLYYGLEEMFVQSEKSLVLFFKDILAHFKLK